MKKIMISAIVFLFIGCASAHFKKTEFGPEGNITGIIEANYNRLLKQELTGLDVSMPGGYGIKLDSQRSDTALLEEIIKAYLGVK